MTDLLKLGFGLWALVSSFYVFVFVVPNDVDRTNDPEWAEMPPLMKRWASWRTVYLYSLVTILGATLTWEAVLALLDR
jgi:hypothetical protein